jgi:hypothetical protein
VVSLRADMGAESWTRGIGEAGPGLDSGMSLLGNDGFRRGLTAEE